MHFKITIIIIKKNSCSMCNSFLKYTFLYMYVCDVMTSSFIVLVHNFCSDYNIIVLVLNSLMYFSIDDKSRPPSESGIVKTERRQENTAQQPGTIHYYNLLHIVELYIYICYNHRYICTAVHVSYWWE